MATNSPPSPGPLSGELAALRELAEFHGVQTCYVDMAHQPRHASAESILAVLAALGSPVQRVADAPEALRDARGALAGRMTEPVHVAWEGAPPAIPLRFPDRASPRRLRCEWRLEDGEERRAEVDWDALRPGRTSVVDEVRWVRRMLPLPPRLPVGYHSLTVECERGRFQAEVFRAREKCFQAPAGSRSWGVFAPLYGLRSERGWGAGNFADLSKFLAWVGERGGRFAGTLPLLPAFLDQPCEPSPYSPVSRLFWNEFYLDLDRVPELASCAAARRLLADATFQGRLRELREASWVDYGAEMALKREALARLSRWFFSRPSSRREAFEEHLRERPELMDYARFRAVHERRGEPWGQWPARMRDGDLRDADGASAARQYHLYVQWLAREQLTEVVSRARKQGVELYLDMPLGTHRDGYDAWRYRDVFALDASGGAPPDPTFTQGQDWGFPPMHPQRSREQGHAYMRAYVRRQLSQARMLRFDHVMGLHRLYWVPRGRPASEGAYVRYPAEEFYALLSIESHRYRAAIIGENLGTVPPEVDRGMRRHGVAGMYVLQYEARPDSRAPLRRAPANAVASFNTHDMPPFAAFWKGLDIADRRDLGLLKPGEEARERRFRAEVRKALAGHLVQGGRLERGSRGLREVFRAAAELLGRSSARWVLLNLEDLWEEVHSQNTPGTTVERVNWRRKLRWTLEEIRDLSEARATLAALDRARD